MNQQSKVEFEAVLDRILGENDETLCALINDAEGGVYRNSVLPIFAKTVTTMQLTLGIPYSGYVSNCFLNVGQPISHEVEDCEKLAADHEDLALAA